VKLYFDFISPYGYLAWKVLEKRELEPIPILFAALLNHFGQKGPAEIPAKRTFAFRDILRKAKAFGVEIAPPPAHPFNPLLALRIATASGDRQVMTKIFDAAWLHSVDVADPVAMAKVVGEELVQKANLPETKALLKKRTEDAIAAGIFGVPAVVDQGEIFWGLDSLPFLDGDKRKIDEDLLARFLGMKAAVQR
jgi:2-hydroxychromene-2-carboxylate isomerase